MDKPIVAKVRESISGQKLVTIPRDSLISGEDYVVITKLELKANQKDDK